jgi:hypothetical protein
MKTQYIKIDEAGNTFYYSDKDLSVYHREDGPAVEYHDGMKEWHRNGELHREDGPAVIYKYGSTEWYRNGKKHREDGPAVEWADGDKSWYLDGVRLTEDEFKASKAPHNGKTVVVDGVEYVLTVK